MKTIFLLKILGVGIFVLILSAYFVIPRYAKNYIQENSIKWTGRKLVLESININYFKGSLTFNDLVIYEKDQTSPFLECKEIFINFNLWESISGKFSVSEMRLLQPTVNVLHQKEAFNFDDLLDLYYAEDTARSSSDPSAPVEFFIYGLAIENGILSYKNEDLKNEIKIVKINGTCPKIAWDDPRENYTFNFLFANGGKAQGTFDLDINTLAYVLDYELDSLNLDMLYLYVEDYMRAGSFAGLFSSEQRIYGNFNQPEAIAATGRLILNNFLLTTPEQGELVKIKEVKAVIDTLNVAGELYNLSYISFLQPVLYLELFEEGNNFTKLLNEVPSDPSGVSSDSISRTVAYGNIFALMATYIRELSENYAISNYKADSLVIREGSFIFNDNTLYSKFNYVLEDLMVKAERVNSEDQNITFVASSILNTSGHMEGSIAVNPEGFRDMDIEYSITGLNMTDFTPYADFWIAHPFTGGICNYRSQTSIKNRYLTSNHKLEILDIEVGKKQKNNTAVNLPFRFAVSLLKDVDGNINLEVPIEGDLEDPKYKVGKVVWQVFKNLINKAVAAPGKLLAKKSGLDENDIKGIVWNPMQTEIQDKQKSSLDAISILLKDTPEISLEILNIYNKPKEEDELALWEGKKLFLFKEKKIADLLTLNAEEELAIKNLPDKDSVFSAFLNRELKLSDPLVSVYEKAKRLIGKENLNAKTTEILMLRNKNIFNYLSQNGIDPNRISISEDNTIANVPYSELSKNALKYNVAED